MSQLAGMLGGGGGATVSPSSSASANGPQAGTNGSLLLDFGGINLGNQDIPLTSSTTASSNAPPTIGTVASSSPAAATLETYLPYILIAGAVVALVIWARSKL